MLTDQAMLHYTRLFFLSLFVILITGCQQPPKIEYIDKHVFVQPPVQTLKEYKAPPPPKPAEFAQLRDDQQVGVLLSIVSEMGDVIQNYTTNIKVLNQWVLEQKKHFDAPPPLKQQE